MGIFLLDRRFSLGTRVQIEKVAVMLLKLNRIGDRIKHLDLALLGEFARVVFDSLLNPIHRLERPNVNE